MLSTQITQDQIGLRLDKFLCQKFDISFALAQKLIREKKVKVNKKRVDAAYRTEDLDEIEIFSDLQNRIVREKQKPKVSPERIRKFLASIIYEDENVIAINKPSGLATQGGSGIEISVDDLLFCLPQTENSQEAPQLVHRLDKDTSGILLIARNKKSAEFLTKSFKEKTIKKTYLALVNGIVKKESGTINVPLRKKFVGNNEKVYPDFEEGKEAITDFKVLKDFFDYTLLELSPQTGRTHQLRVHCKGIGHPIINDIKYGGIDAARKSLSDRLCLHAYKIEFEDRLGKRVAIEADLPDFLANKNKKSGRRK